MQKIKNILYLSIAVLFLGACQPTSSGVPTLTAEGDLNWLSIADAQQINNVEGKLFVVDMYTSWCGWCKKMDAQTFDDPEVKAFLDDKFFVIKMDAETKETINFKGKDYAWKPGGRKGINTLALDLLGGRQSYPTIVYLDENMEKITALPGFKQKDKFIEDLKNVIKMDKPAS